MLQLDVRSLASYPVAVTAVLLCAAIISIKIYQQPETARVALQSPPAISYAVFCLKKKKYHIRHHYRDDHAGYDISSSLLHYIVRTTRSESRDDLVCRRH